jgi:hypothetical protein
MPWLDATPQPALQDRSGLVWSDPATAQRFDPYIAWIELVQLAGRGVAFGDALPIALEIDGGGPELSRLHDQKLLIVPPVYRQAGADLNFATGYAKLSALSALPASVKRVELGLICKPRRLDEAGFTAWFSRFVEWITQPFTRDPPPPAGPSRNIVAIVDTGCAFAHTQFVIDDNGTSHTRVARLWDQGSTSGTLGFSVPKAMRYGREFDAQQLDALIAGGEPARDWYRTTGALGPDEGLGPYLHGTAVAEFAAGAPDPLDSTADADAAGQAEIIFVELPRAAIPDHSGGWLCVHVLDALRYVMANTSPADRVVVNLSVGAHAGPHDGSTLLEQAIDEVIERERPENFAVVIAAGNSFEASGHAELALAPDSDETLSWELFGNDGTESFLELWFDLQPGQQPPTVVLTPPGGPASAEITAGEMKMFLDPPQTRPSAMVFHVGHAAGAGRRLVLCAVVPTAPVQGYDVVASSGEWKVRVRNPDKKLGLQVDAWVERDDRLGQGIGAQSVLKGNRVARTATLSSLASGKHTIVVGAADFADGRRASNFSSSGPARNSTRLSPDVAAPGSDSRDEEDALHTTAVDGISGTARTRGTSIAAPIVARQLLNLMAASAQPMSVAALRSALANQCNPSFPAPGDERLGRGVFRCRVP